MSYTLTDKKYERVLSWINRQRADHKIGKPLKRIPRGVPGDFFTCPVASALTGGKVQRADVNQLVVCLRRANGGEARLRPPTYVEAFITAFDEGACTRLRKLAK